MTFHWTQYWPFTERNIDIHEQHCRKAGFVFYFLFSSKYLFPSKYLFLFFFPPSLRIEISGKSDFMTGIKKKTQSKCYVPTFSATTPIVFMQNLFSCHFCTEERTFAHAHFMLDFAVIFLKHIRVWFKIHWSQWEIFHLISIKWSDTKKEVGWNFIVYNLDEYLHCLSSISCVLCDKVKGSKCSLDSECFIRPTQAGIA